MIRYRRGFTLLELIAAVIISATLAAVSIHYLREPSITGKQRSCDTARELMQGYADRYFEENDRRPSGNLRELATDEYAGITVPVCPVTGDAYAIDRNGVVGCPTHESTRGQ